MLKFNMASIKDDATNNRLSNLDLIRDYAHPDYNIFASDITEDKKAEIYIYIESGRRKSSGKYGYKVQVRVFSIIDNVTDEDLETDGYTDEMLAECDWVYCDTRSEIWFAVNSVIRRAREAYKKLKAKKPNVKKCKAA